MPSMYLSSSKSVSSKCSPNHDLKQTMDPSLWLEIIISSTKITIIKVRVPFSQRKYNELSTMDFIKPRVFITSFNFFLHCLGDCFSPYNNFFNLQYLLLLPLSVNLWISSDTSM